ncbi:hypothetical protein ACJX0J_042249, partial [Zea mays]
MNVKVRRLGASRIWPSEYLAPSSNPPLVLRTCFPKFGNFAIDLCPNCPNMAAGSNECGFYVMGYILFYECNEGSLRSDIEAVRTNLPVNSIVGTRQHMVHMYN